MDDYAEGPHWAMIYGGNNYIIYLVLPVLVGGTRRCTLVSSGVLYIDDTQCPFFALMLYMLLSADLPHEALVAALDIKFSSDIVVIASTDKDEMDEDINRELESVDCKSTHPNLQHRV
jgi:hypothetical protein